MANKALLVVLLAVILAILGSAAALNATATPAPPKPTSTTTTTAAGTPPQPAAAAAALKTTTTTTSTTTTTPKTAKTTTAAPTTTTPKTAPAPARHRLLGRATRVQSSKSSNNGGASDGNGGVVPLTKAQTLRALAEQDMLFKRARLEASANGDEDDGDVAPHPHDQRCTPLAFRKAMEEQEAAGNLSPTAEVVYPKPDYSEYVAAKALTQPINEMYNDNKPVAVVFLGTEEDAVAATNAAEASGCRVCGRSGGHDTSGASSCSGGVVVNVSGLTDIQVDEQNLQARIQVGALWGDVDDALGALGLGGVSGLCPAVGTAGYTLGGGWGALSKMFGMGSDNVISYTVAVAGSGAGGVSSGARKGSKSSGSGNGAQLITAAADNEYSDLFWALRGAGHSSFGLVVAMEYRIFEMPTVAIAQVWFPVDDADVQSPSREVAARALKLWQDQYLNQPPQELSFLPSIGDTADGTFNLVFPAIYGSSDPDAATLLGDLLQPFLDLGGELRLPPTVVPYADAGEYVENVDPPPLQTPPTSTKVYWEYKRGEYATRPLTLEEFRSFVDGVASMPRLSAKAAAKNDKKNGGDDSGDSDSDRLFYRLAYLEGYEGAMVEPAPTDTAFVHRSVGFDVVVDVLPQPAVAGALTAAVDWLADLYETRWADWVGPEAYQNYPSVFYQPRGEALRRYYGENLCRLVEIKEKYDPPPTPVFGWELAKGGKKLAVSDVGGNQGVPEAVESCVV